MALKKNSVLKRSGVRLGLKVAAVLLAVAAVVALFWGVSRSLFQDNPNLVLKRIIVRSGGWWRGKSSEVAEIARLNPGTQNIFEVDLSDTRRLVESEPSVRSARVSRVLPDILVVDIVARIPRAFVHFQGNGKVLDEDCVVMDGCVDVPSTLPVVTGFRSGKNDLLPGNVVLSARPALDLLKRLSESVPGLEVRRVSLGNPDYFALRVRYPGMSREFDLYLDRRKLAGKLAKLGDVLKKSAGMRPGAKVVDMRCDGQAVVR